MTQNNSRQVVNMTRQQCDNDEKPWVSEKSVDTVISSMYFSGVAYICTCRCMPA